MDQLVINDVPIECINQAAVTYYVPAALIISVLTIENGRVGMAKENKNGTLDYGPMQINSIWVSKVERYGYTKQMLQYDPCVNVAIGTWILSQAIASGDSLWQGVGNYHSHTLELNTHYRSKVEKFYQFLNNYLQGTQKVAEPTPALPKPTLKTVNVNNPTPNVDDDEQAKKPIPKAQYVEAIDNNQGQQDEKN